MSTIEKRMFACDLQAKEENENQPTIEGYASVFNTRSENLGGFFEIIMPGAFDGVLGDDVRALFNHDPNFVLGRRSSDTLELNTDESGLSYTITAPSTQTIRDLVIEPMKRGDIDQSSFAFSVDSRGDEWTEGDDGVIIRKIHKIKRLYDVSPVTYSAYNDAKAATRSMQLWKKARSQGEIKKALHQKQARERVLDLISNF